MKDEASSSGIIVAMSEEGGSKSSSKAAILQAANVSPANLQRRGSLQALRRRMSASSGVGKSVVASELDVLSGVVGRTGAPPGGQGKPAAAAMSTTTEGGALAARVNAIECTRASLTALVPALTQLCGESTREAWLAGRTNATRTVVSLDKQPVAGSDDPELEPELKLSASVRRVHVCYCAPCRTSSVSYKACCW